MPPLLACARGRRTACTLHLLIGAPAGTALQPYLPCQPSSCPQAPAPSTSSCAAPRSTTPSMPSTHAGVRRAVQVSAVQALLDELNGEYRAATRELAAAQDADSVGAPPFTAGPLICMNILPHIAGLRVSHATQRAFRGGTRAAARVFCSWLELHGCSSRFLGSGAVPGVDSCPARMSAC
jgi:hypothetical protein